MSEEASSPDGSALSAGLGHIARLMAIVARVKQKYPMGGVSLSLEIARVAIEDERERTLSECHALCRELETDTDGIARADDCALAIAALMAKGPNVRIELRRDAADGA